MSIVKYKEGGVSVAVDFDTAALLKLAVNAATGGVLDVMEKAAEEVAATARAEWYAKENVTRRTGKSGDIQVVTTVSEHEVRVSVGSTYEKAIYVHRSKATATEAVEIDYSEYLMLKAAKNRTESVIRSRRAAKELTESEYQKLKRALATSGKVATVFHAGRNNPEKGILYGRYYRVQALEITRDGKFLVPELVRKPAKLKFTSVIPQISAAIAARIGRGGSIVVKK